MFSGSTNTSLWLPLETSLSLFLFYHSIRTSTFDSFKFAFPILTSPFPTLVSRSKALISTIFLETSGISSELCFTCILCFRDFLFKQIKRKIIRKTTTEHSRRILSTM
ncbi:hypothetical protein CIPAW_06G094900 [Carya illinoinensis]|uniref:Uncharacterized protein n=1 Tax=Carya illinoinensis TaxID=32201 RepID=A0A8T1QA49_CARIL|nr:hypothetical protein CIPAW_06G094900 [Carya illinoinensis]